MDTQESYPDKTALITASTVAAECGISRSAFYKLVACGRAPKPVKLGRSARWSRQVILDWIAAGCPARDRMR